MRRAAAGMMKKLTFRIDTWVTVSAESDRAREGIVVFVPVGGEPPVTEAAGRECCSDETCVKPRPITAAAASPTRAAIRIIGLNLWTLSRRWSGLPREYAETVPATRIG